MNDWRDNPALVDCFNSFRAEMETMKNDIELELLQWSGRYAGEHEKHKAMVLLGHNLRIRREQLKLSKTRLAIISGVARRSITTMEQNGGTPAMRGKINNVLDRLESHRMAAD